MNFISLQVKFISLNINFFKFFSLLYTFLIFLLYCKNKIKNYMPILFLDILKHIKFERFNKIFTTFYECKGYILF